MDAERKRRLTVPLAEMHDAAPALAPMFPTGEGQVLAAALGRLLEQWTLEQLVAGLDRLARERGKCLKLS